MLGLNESHITIFNHTHLPDSMKEKWPVELVARLILEQVEIYDIDTLITFDKCGISGHINHCSIYYSIAHLSIEKQLPQSEYHLHLSLIDHIFCIHKHLIILSQSY